MVEIIWCKNTKKIFLLQYDKNRRNKMEFIFAENEGYKKCDKENPYRIYIPYSEN